MHPKLRGKIVGFALFLLALSLHSPHLVRSHAEGQASHQVYQMGDLKLESGQVIKDFSISFVTHGKLNAAKSNAVLMCSSLVGDHHRIDFLIGPGKALDTDKYFIICTDAIGNGLTTSPSNSKAQPGPKFPAFNIRDMVASQYRLVTEHFGLKRLLAVTGASMGGMQSLQWAVSHPGFMDAVVALSPSARTTSWEAAFWTASRSIFEMDPAFEGGNYRTQPEKAWRTWTDFVLALGANNPQGIRFAYPDAKDGVAYLKGFEDNWLKKGFDANNCIAQQNAVMEHNIGNTQGFQGDFVKALGSIKARVLALPCQGDILVPPFIEEDARFIRNCEVATIPTQFGHFGATASFSKADVLFMNTRIRTFLDDVTDSGRTIR